MPEVHVTAVVERGAELGDGVYVGPFCHIGANVRLTEGVRVISHAVIAGRTTIGPNTHIYPFASIGHRPQDLKYEGEPSELILGANNTIREHVTIHRGSKPGGMTVIGDGNFIMVGAHFGHDVRIGDRNVIANGVLLGGHVHIGNNTFLGGGAVFHQFLRIGDFCVIQGNGSFSKDIPHYCAAQRINRVTGLNIVGLQRRGFSREDIHTLRRAYRLLFADEGTLVERMEDVEKEFKDHPIVTEIIAFIRERGKRGLCMPHAEA